jgi:hypothetical protein
MAKEDVRKNIIIIALFSVILFNVCYNVTNYPTFFWDQGVYIERAINFIKDYVVYDDPTYIDHPPLGWIIPSLIFKAIGFPDLISHINGTSATDIREQVMILFLIPRLIAVTFTMIVSILIYRIASIMYDDRNLAAISLASFSIIPAMWPFRNMLLDPIMITFVLMSLYLLISTNIQFKEMWTAHKKKVWTRLLLSGLLFGIALLVKLTAIFFLPAVLLFALGYGLSAQRQSKLSTSSHFDSIITIQTTGKEKTKSAVLWLFPVFGCLASWVFFLNGQHLTHSLIATQLWQISRPSFSPLGIVLSLILMTSPIGAIFGILGLAKTVTDREKRTWSVLGIPYLAFLFRGGYVGWVHVIPILPFLSIYAGKPLFQLTQLIFLKLKRNKNSQADQTKISNFLVISILAVSVIITIWLTSFNEAGSDQQAIQFLISNTPKNAILVTDPGYGWVIKLYRPDLNVINYYLLEKMDTPPSSFYISEKDNPSKYDPSLQKLDVLYYKSCMVKIFENNPSNNFFHPYSVVQDKWWNVEVRYFDAKDCTGS